MHDDFSHLVHFYKKQLADIRAAFEALELDTLDLSKLESAIYDKTAEEIEDIPRRTQEELARIRQDGFIHRGEA